MWILLLLLILIVVWVPVFASKLAPTPNANPTMDVGAALAAK